MKKVAGPVSTKPVDRTLAGPDDKRPIRVEGGEAAVPQRGGEPVPPCHKGVGADLHQAVPGSASVV